MEYHCSAANSVNGPMVVTKGCKDRSVKDQLSPQHRVWGRLVMIKATCSRSDRTRIALKDHY